MAQNSKSAQDNKQIDEAMAAMGSISADDPDMMAKLNEIALKVAEAQGKRPASSSNTNSTNNVAADPMDELGCEGCQ